MAKEQGRRCGPWFGGIQSSWEIWEENGGSARRGRRVLAAEVATEDAAQGIAGLIVEPINVCPLFLASFISSLSWAKIQNPAAYRYPEENFYRNCYLLVSTLFSQEPWVLSGSCSRPSADPVVFFPLWSLHKGVGICSSESSLCISNSKCNCWGRKVGLCVGEFLQGIGVILKLRADVS